MIELPDQKHIEALYDSEGLTPDNYEKVDHLRNYSSRLSNRATERRFVYINPEHQCDVWERLPTCSRKKIRNEIRNAAIGKARAAGIPFIQKWYWPQGARSYFTFRADMDGGDGTSLSRFIEGVQPWRASLSLFVCGKAYAGKSELLKMTVALGAEIGNHTYTHFVFSDRKRNRLNLELTEVLLSRNKVIPKGYVGPASFWHRSMYQVLEEKGYEYTSSFGLSHDDFPSFIPKSRHEMFSMVELPFHCLGDCFPKFGMNLDSEEVGEFFDRLIKKKYHLCEPMFIYGHPDMPGRMGDYPKLVARICNKALSYDDVRTGNMADIAEWWRIRHATKAEIEFDRENRLVIAREYRGSNDVYWSIQVDDDYRYLVSARDLRSGVRLDALQQYKRISLMKSPHEIIGEVDEGSVRRSGRKTKLQRWFREWQRQRKMDHSLRNAIIG